MVFLGYFEYIDVVFKILCFEEFSWIGFFFEIKLFIEKSDKKYNK